tara:strand:+ start:106 stop:330 length:225 start_codon:yes stop_codon:yes gene_type:complete
VSIISIINGLLGALDKLLGGIGDRRKEDNGANRNRVEQMRYDQDAAAKAVEARRAAERGFDRDGLPEDDPNRRD